MTGRSYLVGLVVPDLLHPFFAEVAKALSTAIRKKGYLLIISASEEDLELDTREIRHLQARRLDALVVATTRTHASDFEELENGDGHFVLIDREISGRWRLLSAVRPDQQKHSQPPGWGAPVCNEPRNVEDQSHGTMSVEAEDSADLFVCR